MRDKWRWLVLLAVALPALPVAAQDEEAQPGPEASSPAKEIDVYVFPKKGQSANQQQKDESDCYAAAKQQSGVDPSKAAPRKPTAAQQRAAAEQGAMNAERYSGAKTRGAVGGGAIGALGGAIFGAPLAGAVIGAGVGTVRGHRRQEEANEEAQDEAAAHAVSQQNKAYSRKKAAYDKEIGSFKRAFGACLDSRGYSVK